MLGVLSASSPRQQRLKRHACMRYHEAQKLFTALAPLFSAHRTWSSLLAAPAAGGPNSMPVQTQYCFSLTQVAGAAQQPHANTP